MPTLEQIRSLKITASTTGVTQATAELTGLSAAQADVAKTAGVMATETDKNARKQLPIAEQYRKQTLALDEAARALDRYQKAKAVADQALAQGVILGPEHAQRVADLAAKYEQASVASKLFATATAGVSGQLIAMAAGAGPVGVLLSAIPGWGLAAAVGLGVLATAFNAVRDAALQAGEKARGLQEMSEATKLTIDQVRALKRSAGEFGVGGDQIETWLQRATIGMETARSGSGELADALRAIDPAFLSALNNATTMADRLDVLARAAAAAKEQGKEVGLFWRDAFGRGSGRADPVMAATQLAGGIAAAGAAMKDFGGVTSKEIEERGRLSRETEKLKGRVDDLKASFYGTKTILEAEVGALKLQVDWWQALNNAKKQQIATELELQRAVQQRVQGSDAEAIVNRARTRNRVGSLTPTADRDMALQEGATPTEAITKQTAAVDALTVARRKLSDDTRWIGALGAGATSAEMARLAIDKLNVAMEAGDLGAKNSAQAQALYKRALEEINVQANAVTATHAAAIQTLQARTAAERQAAAAATVRAGGGGDAEVRAQQAVTMEIEKQAAAHRDAMIAMRGQLAVAQAVTGAEKMKAQEAATYRDLIRQGRTEQQAAAEAAMQTAIAQANVNTSVQQTIVGLQQELELLQARTQSEKDAVAARQAYDNAVASGADAETARRLQAATAAVSEEKRRQAEENAKLQAQDQARLALCKQMVAEEEAYSKEIEKIYSGQSRLIDQMGFDVGAPGAAGSSTTERIETGLPWWALGSSVPVTQATPETWEPELRGLRARGYTQAHVAGSGYSQWLERGEIDQGFLTQQGQQPFEMSRVRAQIGGDKPAEIAAVQGELAYMRTRPETLENLNAIKSLMDAVKELTDATKAQTATLDDIYGSGHAALRIGYYNEGTSTQTIGQPTIATNDNVWRSPITTAPPTQQAPAPSPLERYRFGIPAFAEGGTVTRPTLALVGESGPEEITPIRTSAVNKRGSGPPTVVQNFVINMPARSDLGDRTTQRQAFEGIGRRAAAVR